MSCRRLEEEDAATLELDCGTSFARTLEEEPSLRRLEEEEDASLELDCGTSLARTLEEELSLRRLEEEDAASLELDCGTSLARTLELSELDEVGATVAAESAVLVSSSNSANKSRTCAFAEEANNRAANNGKRANLCICL